tara:strand:+ start:491 stop:1171 length:681 start_codon:yes stop_codon:yes gene_type:complete
MNWEDECYLLSKRKFRENANIINIFSPSKGKVSGVVYGGNSRKIRNYLQLSNKLFISYNSKNENKLGYFKTELMKPISPLYFNDRKRTSALVSICSMLNILLPESQPNRKIYSSLEKFISSIKLDNWIILYIFFELNLIKELGFDPNLIVFADKVSNSSDIQRIKIDNNVFEIPGYLILKKLPQEISNDLIKKSLYFTRNIIQNKFFNNNNVIFPQSRVQLENYFR